VNILNNNKKTK